ncbi:MAG TPA: hypothetical protein VHX15_15045 [Frankiaceae bacterium]|nr:hypothetical protein [Frankiaceae bacterium]
MIQRSVQAHVARWGLGSADRWDLDQTTGVIRWTFADKIVEAPAQFTGTYSARGRSWMWAWANDTLLPAMCRTSGEVRRWGEANGHVFLQRPQVEASAEQAEDIAAIAFRISRATGFYRAPAGASVLYLTFGTVTITPTGGAPEEFSIGVE